MFDRKIYHINLQFIYAACFNVPDVMIVKEYMPMGSLKDIIFSDELELDIPTTLDLCLQIVAGMNHLHSLKKPMVHGNLKMSNILVGQHAVIVLFSR